MCLIAARVWSQLQISYQLKKGVKGGAIIGIILFFFTIVLEFHFKTFVSQEMLVELVSGGLLVPISYQTLGEILKKGARRLSWRLSCVLNIHGQKHNYE